MRNWDWLLKDNQRVASIKRHAHAKCVDINDAWEAHCKNEMTEALKFVKSTLGDGEMNYVRMWAVEFFLDFYNALQEKPWCTDNGVMQNDLDLFLSEDAVLDISHEKGIDVNDAWELYCKHEMRAAITLMKSTLKQEDVDVIQFQKQAAHFRLMCDALQKKPWLVKRALVIT